MRRRRESRTRMPLTAGSTCAVALVALLGASGCSHHRYAALPEPSPAASMSTHVYSYPKRGQSPERQDRDRYECYLWAMRQSRFDPSRTQVASAQRVRVIPTRPPIADTFSGAAAGALIGSAVDHYGDGAWIGAAIGALAGAISDTHRALEYRALERSFSAQPPPGQGPRAHDYRRALSACLEGRGYVAG